MNTKGPAQFYTSVAISKINIGTREKITARELSISRLSRREKEKVDVIKNLPENFTCVERED